MSRHSRIAEQIQRELSTLLQMEIKDPRLGMVTVSDVDLSRDLTVAKVYVTRLDDLELNVEGSKKDTGKKNQNLEESKEASLKVLEKSSGFLKKELGRRLVLRTIPQLKFYYDESIERGRHLSQLIDKAVKTDEEIVKKGISNSGEES